MKDFLDGGFMLILRRPVLSFAKLASLLLFLLVATPKLAMAQEGTAGVSMVEAAPDTSFRTNWGVSYFSIGGLSQEQIEKGNGSFSAYNYIALNYKFSKARRISLRPVFYFNTTGINKYNEQVGSSSSLGDLHLVYSDYEIASFADVEVSTSFKLYLPTSQFTAMTGNIAKFRPETYITKKVGSFSSVSYVLKPDYFIQSHNTYLDENAPLRKDGQYPKKNTQMAALEHYVEFNASMSQKFSIKPSVGFEDEWFNASPSENMTGFHNTKAKLALAFDYRVARKVTFTLGFENKPKIINRRDELAFFRPEDNGAFLMTNASLL